MIKTKSRKTQGIKIIFENCFAIFSIDILLVVDKNSRWNTLKRMNMLKDIDFNSFIDIYHPSYLTRCVICKLNR